MGRRDVQRGSSVIRVIVFHPAIRVYGRKTGENRGEKISRTEFHVPISCSAVTTVRDTRWKFEISVRSVILSKTLGPSITRGVYYIVMCGARYTHIITQYFVRAVLSRRHASIAVADHRRRPINNNNNNNNSSSLRVRWRSWCIVRVVLLSVKLSSRPKLFGSFMHMKRDAAIFVDTTIRKIIFETVYSYT